jgi:phage baseplate assembly protein W
MASRQYFGIKYPFTNNSVMERYVDINETRAGGVRSRLLHVVFTPKGQRIREPEFGTDLIKYIFEQNDENSWDKVKTEIKNTVRRWVPEASINDINVVDENEDGAAVFVRLDYSVQEGNQIINDSVVVQL